MTHRPIGGTKNQGAVLLPSHTRRRAEQRELDRHMTERRAEEVRRLEWERDHDRDGKGNPPTRIRPGSHAANRQLLAIAQSFNPAIKTVNGAKKLRRRMLRKDGAR